MVHKEYGHTKCKNGDNRTCAILQTKRTVPKKFTNQIFWTPKKEKFLGEKNHFQVKNVCENTLSTRWIESVWKKNCANSMEKFSVQKSQVTFVRTWVSICIHHTWWPLSIYNLGCVLFLNLNQTRGHFFTSFSPLTYQNNLFSFKPFFIVPIVRCPIALVGFVFLPILAFILFWSLPTHQTYSNRIVENKPSQPTKTYTRTQFSKSCYRNENWNGTCCFVLQRMRM